MSILKKILIGLAVLIVLLLGTMILIPIFYETEIKEAVEKQINRSVTAKVQFHDFNLTLFKNFPHFTFTLNDFSIINKAPFQGDTLVAVKDFNVAVNMMSVVNYLRSGEQLKIRSIALNQPHINAQVLKDGTANWSITKGEKDTTTQKPPAEKSEKQGKTPFNIGLQSFEINKADITYNDQSMGFYLNIDQLTHQLSGDFTQDKFTVETYTTAQQVTTAYGGVNYLNHVEMEIDADMGINLKNSKYTFKDNTIRLNALPLGIDGFVAMKEDVIKTDLRYEAKKTKFKHILSLVPAIYAKNFSSIETKGKMGV